MGLALTLAASQSAVAQTAAPVEVNIAAQSLAQALNELARQAKLQILVAPDLVAGKTAPVVSGSLVPTEALRRLLAGSGLEAVAQGGSIVIRRAPPAATESEATLPEVRVRASAEPLPGELPKPFAGGQVARGGSVGVLGNRDVFETPFNVTNFTEAFIADRQATSVGQIVKRDPSVRVANTGTAFAEDYLIRGFRVTGNATTFEGLNAVFPQYGANLLQAIERVEVFKGANTLLAGSSGGLTVGGTVNLVPKRATDQAITQFTASYLSDSRVGGHLDIGRRFGTDNAFGIRLNAFDRQGRTAIDNEHEHLRLLAAALDFRGERLRVTLDAGQVIQDIRGAQASLFADAEAGIPIPPPPKAGSNFAQPFNFSYTTTYYAVLRSEFDVATGWTAFAALGGNRSNSRQLLPFGLLKNGDGDIDEIYQNGSNHDWTNAWEVGVRGKFATGAVEHQVVASYVRPRFGNEGSFVFSEADGSQATVASNIYRPVRVAIRPDLLFPGEGPFTGRNKNLTPSFAVTDTLSMFEKRLQLTLGLRDQRLNDARATTPAVALLYKLTPQLAVYGNYIESLQGGPTAPDNVVNRGEIFPPSRNKQYEVGMKYDGGTFGGSVDVFQITEPSGVTKRSAADPTQLVFVLDGRQRHRGIELNLFGEPMRGLRLTGGLVLLQARLVETQDGLLDGKRVKAVPATNATLSAEWDIGAGWAVSGGVVRTGAVYTDQANSQRIAAFTELDLGASWKTRLADMPMTLRANLSNPTNKAYWVGDVYGSFYQAAPRTLTLSATVDF